MGPGYILSEIVQLLESFQPRISEDLRPQDSVCVGLTQNKLVCVFMVMKEYVTQCNSVAYLNVFGEQWTFLAQMILRFDSNLCWFWFLIIFIDNKKNMFKYHQCYPLILPHVVHLHYLSLNCSFIRLLV